MEIIKIDPSSLNSEELLKVLSQNAVIAKEMRREIARAESLQKILYEPTDYMREKELKLNSCIESDMVDEDFEDDISLYLLELAGTSKITTKEDLIALLPDKSQANYELIINRLLIELSKQNALIKKYVQDEEELSTFSLEISKNNHQISLLRELMAEEELDLTETLSSNHLIFVPSATGIPRALEELSHIDSAYYAKFLGLFESIKNATFKNFSRMSSNNQYTKGFGEVKDFKVRVVFDRLDKDTYAIISVFTKKTTKNKEHCELLNLRCSQYRKVKALLKENIKNPEFLKIQDDYEQELFRLLGQKEKSGKKEKVKTND